MAATVIISARSSEAQWKQKVGLALCSTAKTADVAVLSGSRPPQQGRRPGHSPVRVRWAAAGRPGSPSSAVSQRLR